MNPRALLDRLVHGQLTNVRFADAQRLAQALGFELDRVRGSHHIYRHPAIGQRINLQAQGWANQALPASTAPRPRGTPRPAAEGQRLVSEYHINVFWSEEDQAWVADIPDLQHCSALGTTPQEALAEVLTAKQAWLDSAREHGDALPTPRYRPAIYAAAPPG